MRKGQTIVFEQVLLFGLSVAIFIACLGVFQLYQAHFTFTSLNDQVRAVRDMISSQVLETVRFGDLDATVNLRIPKRISGEKYHVIFSESGFNVTTTETKTTASTDLYHLRSRFTFIPGKAESAKGEIIIYKTGNNIILGEYEG